MELEDAALDDSIKTFILHPNDKTKYDLHIFLTRSTNRVLNVLRSEQASLPSMTGLKFQLSLKVQLKRYVYEEDIETVKTMDPFFNSASQTFNDSKTDSAILQDVYNEIRNNFEGYIIQGSGWMLDFISFLRLKLIRYKLYSGGNNCHNLPQGILRTKACRNVICNDNRCFIYCCLVAIHNIKKTQRLTAYRNYIDQLNLDNVHFPMTINQIPRFERDNPNLSINVLSYNDSCPIPIYCTQNRASSCHQINLLLHNKHFVLIHNMSRLLYKYCPPGKSYHFCHFCLCRFSSKKKLIKHKNLCRQKLQKLDTGSVYESVHFKNYRHMFQLPFVIYYDTECIITQNVHEPISICAFRKCSNDLFSRKPIVFTGDDCIERFLEHLKREEQEILNILDIVEEPLRCDAQDDDRIEICTQCEVCGTKFDKYEPKYRDHDHINTSSKSNLRFILCNRCNLTYGASSSKIPVVCHNASKYDIHFIVSKLKSTRGVKVLAKTTEQYLSLTMGTHLVFLDSLNFINGSLDALTRELSAKDNNNLDQYLNYITTNCTKQKCLHRKGIFPYEWLNDKAKLETQKLPQQSDFFSRLKNEHVNQEDYNHALKVWETFQCRSIREYLELYLVLDVLLLAANVETYRHETYKHMKLDPLHYVSSPSLCFDAMLKITNIHLETLPSVDMYLWFNKAIRGGLSGASVRYARANNPSVHCYNPQKELTYIVGFDLNALYSYAMCFPLPYKSFRFLNANEIQSLNIDSISLDDDTGFFLEVDLDYPEELHDKHCQYPLAPEKVAIKPNQWSDYMQTVCDKLGMKKKSAGEKLVATLYDKKHYILHYYTLQLYLRLGMKLVKVHRVVSFKQKRFMKKYIHLNIEKRKNATSSFDVALYKLYNNSVFGKCMYNVFKQTNYQLVSQKNVFQRLAAKPTFNSCQVIHDRLVGVQMKPNTIRCNKPIYIGATILDIAKHHMYSFYYDYLQPMYGYENIQMLYTDTDSFYLSIKNQPQFYEDILQNERFFDRSNYKQNHFLFSEKRKRELGLMKDVHAKEVINEFVCLRAKMYAVKTENDTEDIKAKGLKKSVLHDIRTSTFKTCLRDLQLTKHRFDSIRSFNHKVKTHSTEKIGLSPFDDKRYYLSCGIHSFAHGHYKIRDGYQNCSCDGVS